MNCVAAPRSDTDAILDQQGSKFLAIDEPDAVLDAINIGRRISRKVRGRDEDPLTRALPRQGADEALEIRPADFVGWVVALDLNVNGVETQCVLINHAVDPAIT